MFDLVLEVYVRLVESFGVVFGLVGQVFKYRPWMLPLIPVAGLIIYFSVKIGSQGQAGPAVGPRRPELQRRSIR